MTIAILAHQTGVPIGQAYAVLCDLAPRARKIGHRYKIKGAEIPAVRAALLASKRPPRPLPQVKEAPMNEPEGMTLVQIAELCKVGVTTVRRWADAASAEMAQVRAKLADALEAKKPARFDKTEVLAIVAAGGRGHEADLLASSSRPPDPPRAAKLPAGIQLRELRMIYGAAEAGKRLDVLLGYTRPAPAIEAPAAPAEASLGFAALRAVAAGLPSDTIAKAARAGAAATEAVIRRELARVSADAGQGRLGL